MPPLAYKCMRNILLRMVCRNHIGSDAKTDFCDGWIHRKWFLVRNQHLFLTEPKLCGLGLEPDLVRIPVDCDRHSDSGVIATGNPTFLRSLSDVADEHNHS